MFNEKMNRLGLQRSAIRTIAAYADKRKKEIGEENVFDFSLGNPSVPAPQCVNDTIIDLVKNTDSIKLHGYTAASGDLKARQLLAEDLNRRFSTQFCADNLFLTLGAAASLKATVLGLYEENDEFIAIAPYFCEYKVLVETIGATLVEVPASKPDFQIDFGALDAAIGPHTKAVIINSPNNPTGVVYSNQTYLDLAALLEKKSAQYGKVIFLISDEPYRELVYNHVTLPFVTTYYRNTIVCYSFSKSLSLPGERIGYVLVGDEVENTKNVYAAISGAGRALGYVCATSLFQQVVALCASETSEISIYKKNRDLLYQTLQEIGFSCVHPDGAFYLFIKAPLDDANEFVERAKKYEIMLVAADEFGCPGYVRLAYCVQTELIERSLSAFKRLASEYGL